MNIKEYSITYELEDIHWWYVGMRKIYFGLLNKFYKHHNKLIILDVGCGTGGMLGYFKKYGSPVGIDISTDALYFSCLRGQRNLLCASVTKLPFTNESFDLISAFGIIYHNGVEDDFEALRECYRVLKKKGRIILLDPAYNFLRSRHDEAVHTRHRYTKYELKNKMWRVGFKLEKITYSNTILFPLIALWRILRKLNKTKDSAESDLKSMPSLINRILLSMLFIEAKLLKIIDFPFGLSILCIARK